MQQYDLDGNKVPERDDIVERLEAALYHLYSNCPVTPAQALRRNPHMLGDATATWMNADKVFNVLARYGFDTEYLEDLDDKFGERYDDT